MTKDFRIKTSTAIAIFLFIAIALASINVKAQPAKEALIKQQLFEKIFGEKARLDTVMVRKVKTGVHGKRHYVDTDGDGKPDEVWFIDTSLRHSEKKRPILVRVIDEDGDLIVGGEPDRDSDLYVADWNADGTVDVIVDYQDVDGDQDVDQMGLYFYDKRYGLRVWWSRDDGDDNLLWYDIDYTYYQEPCQNHSHFGGDETFVSCYIKADEDHWTSYWENPFLFFDRDGDGITEETLRIEGVGNLPHSVRWSFDVDNDATLEQPRDFDVSISAYFGAWTLEKHLSGQSKESFFGDHEKKNYLKFRYGKSQSEPLIIRGFPTDSILKRNSATNYLQQVQFARVLMTWDENDLNIAKNPHNNPNTIERWEGIIAAPSVEPGFEFPAIGGPHCGPFNKRYELVLKPNGPNEYYFNPADRRIHILNSDKTWLYVDYNNDNKMDLTYLWTDVDNDGIMDKISVDVDGDGKTDDSWNLDVSGVKPVQWNFRDLNTTYHPVIQNEPRNLYALNKSLVGALESLQKGAGKDIIWDIIEDRMQQDSYPADLAKRLIDSDESLLYYLTLVADRRIVWLKKLFADKSFWKIFYTARSQGDTEKMVVALNNQFRLLSVGDYALWLNALRANSLQKQVAWSNTWLPPNWGWESEKAAFRFYDGHFDLFGKRLDTLIYPGISKGKNYHQDVNGWGMDILHVNKTSGCGGLTLYVNGVPYPVRNEKAPGDPTFTGRLMEETDNKVTIELLAKGVGPADAPYTVKWRLSALAGRADSPLEVIVEGGKQGDKIELGIGLTRMNDETFISDTKNGIICSWGFQDPEIGWIGMGVVYPASQFIRVDSQPDEHRVVLRCEKGRPMVYHIQGDWLRGHQFPCCPSADDWHNKVKKTAKLTGLNQ